MGIDAEQMSYALDNLLRALVRSLGDGTSLTVTASESGQITIRWPAGNGRGIGKLAAMLTTREDDTEPALPLGFALARSLVKRNGGQLEIEKGSAGVTVSIQLPGEDGVGRVTTDDRPSTTADR